VCRSGGVVVHREFPNRTHVRQRAGILREFGSSNYCAVPQITPAVFREIVGDTCDCIIVDPPFGHGGWTHSRFRDFIVSLKRTIHHCFIVCWLDPDAIAPIIEIFHSEKFVFCDSIVVELLDGFNRPLTLYSDKCGLPRNSRMAVMFRTNDITRSDLRQQRVKDTGYGIVDPVGKTYGRPSTPKTAHTIIEVMLPPKKTGPRVFVELWPNFFHRRKNWILIDEIEKREPAEAPDG
jgi:hypothetical protein